MIVKTCTIFLLSCEILVVIVDSKFTHDAAAADELLWKISRHRPLTPAMLVSVEANGFKAYAPFETAKFLALLQLEELQFEDLDVAAPPPEKVEELPF